MSVALRLLELCVKVKGGPDVQPKCKGLVGPPSGTESVSWTHLASSYLLGRRGNRITAIRWPLRRTEW